MKALSKQAQQIFDRIIADVQASAKLNNAPGTYTPLCVEDISLQYDLPARSVWSFAHYGESNGDAMRDPEMIFFLRDFQAYPIYYRNDWAGVEQMVARVVRGSTFKCYGPADDRKQSQQAAFANTWMANIQEQQLS